ncbi:ATPase [Skermanella stibiiresistens SB22]|uniref:ATPase n=1 Tax=Skermanella stibiiresistens SB22 TaxID=1385369 RepID=W9H7S2_9PROT|nr:ATP12 family protein [Skermanella stibiiresistens]EWY39848.1 ATPase [Skermanella stibiiresistens SB22]
MKRFYKEVTVAETEAGHEVRLDGRPLRTPAKAPLVLPKPDLMRAIAEEWDGQVEHIKPAQMPITQLASTAIDRIPAQRDEIVKAVAAYGATDLLCYRADQPISLAERQATVWQPLLDWASVRYGATLHVHVGIMPRPQPEDACVRLAREVENLDDLILAGVQNATSELGSLVLALALLERRVSAEEAYAAAQLDETFQIEQWGEDREAMIRRANLKADIIATRRYLDLVRA